MNRLHHRPRKALLLSLSSALAVTLLLPGAVGHATDLEGGEAAGLLPATALMFSAGVDSGGPGYVDIVGEPAPESGSSASWKVSSRGPVGMTYRERDQLTTHRIIIPKFVSDPATATARPVISDVQYRSDDYREAQFPLSPRQVVDVPDEDSLRQLEASPFPEVRLTGRFYRHVSQLPADDRLALIRDVHARFARENPDSLYVAGLQETGDAAAIHTAAMSGFGGHDTWVTQEADTRLRAQIPDGEPVFLRDSEGHDVRFLNAVRWGPDTDTPGDIRVFYQPITPYLRDSLPRDSQDPGPLARNEAEMKAQYPDLGFGATMTTNLEREIFEATVPAAELAGLDRLPEGQEVETDPEADALSYLRLAAEAIGEPVDSGTALTTDLTGAFYGNMVLPVEQTALQAVELPVDQSSYLPGVAGGFPRWNVAEALDTVGSTEPALVYQVFDSPPDVDGLSDYWVVDYVAPPMQVEFRVTVGVTDSPAAEPVRAVNDSPYLVAQVYAAQVCRYFDDDGDPTFGAHNHPWLADHGVPLSCRALLDVPWGAGVTTASTPAPATSGGITRGSLVISEAEMARLDAAPPNEALRGVFGNPHCLVTRDTADPGDRESLATTVLPTDLNHLFPGEGQNSVGPDNPFLRFPDNYRSYAATYSMTEDNCDQAAVPVTPLSTGSPWWSPWIPAAAAVAMAGLVGVLISRRR